MCSNQRSIMYTFSRWYNKLAQVKCVLLSWCVSEWARTIQAKCVQWNVDKSVHRPKFSDVHHSFSHHQHALFTLLLFFCHAYKLLFVWHNMHINCERKLEPDPHNVIYYNDSPLCRWCRFAMIVCAKFHISWHSDKADAASDDDDVDVDDNGDFVNKSDILFSHFRHYLSIFSAHSVSIANICTQYSPMRRFRSTHCHSISLGGPIKSRCGIEKMKQMFIAFCRVEFVYFFFVKWKLNVMKNLPETNQKREGRWEMADEAIDSDLQMFCVAIAIPKWKREKTAFMHNKKQFMFLCDSTD